MDKYTVAYILGGFMLAVVAFKIVGDIYMVIQYARGKADGGRE